MSISITELLTKLISFKTITGNHADCNACFDYIKEYLGKDFYYKHYYFNEFPSLLISNTSNMQDFDVLFNAHIDVVEGDDKDFVGYIEEDRLFGRGSIDMKGQIATILHLLKHNTFPQNIGFLITSDEESGGHNGTEVIVGEGKIKAQLVIVPDAGENFSFVDSEKALLQLDLVTTGTSAHSSQLNLGSNAIVDAMNVYNRLCQYFELDPSKPICDSISINLSKITSGNLYNKVPDTAIWALDIRHSNITKSEIEKILTSICDANNTIFSIHNYANEFKCKLDNANVAKFISLCEEYLKHPLIHIHESGASDIGYFAKAGMPAVSINPEGYNMHASHENVVLSSLTKFEKMLLHYLNNF